MLQRKNNKKAAEWRPFLFYHTAAIPYQIDKKMGNQYNFLTNIRFCKESETILTKGDTS